MQDRISTEHVQIVGKTCNITPLRKEMDSNRLQSDKITKRKTIPQFDEMGFQE